MSCTKSLNSPFFEAKDDETYVMNAEFIKESQKGIIKKHVTEKNHDVSEVEQLNPYMGSVSKPSKIIENVNWKRKYVHESLMKKLAGDLNELNLKIEENIRISSENIKAHIAAYKSRLNEILKSLDVPEVAHYRESVFLGIQKEVDDMKENQIEMVEGLYKDFCKLENLRAKENERIFQMSFSKIEKTAFFLPYEMQTFIEHEILRMNQLMLNNRRCYEDLKLNLRLLTEKTFKCFMDEVFCLKGKWMRKNAKEICDNMKTEPEEKADGMHQKSYLRIEVVGYQLPLTKLDHYYSIVESNDWFENVDKIVFEIAKHERMLSEILRKAISVVNENRSGDYEAFRKSLLSLHILEFRDHVIQPIIFTKGIVREESLYDLETLWQGVLKNVKIQVEDVIYFLSNFDRLWHGHCTRLCESKISILEAMEKEGENRHLAVQDLETEVNLSLDSLKQESGKEKLETLYTTVVSQLDSIKEKLESRYLKEVSITEEFHKMMILEAHVFSAEIKDFIYVKYPMRHEMTEGVFDMSKIAGENKKNAISYEISQLMAKINFLGVLKNRALMALESFSNEAGQLLECKAREWIQMKMQNLTRKLEIQNKISGKRCGRIRSQIYETKLEEIAEHERASDEQKEGENDGYSKLPEEADPLTNAGYENMGKNDERVISVVEKAINEEEPSTVDGICSQLQREKFEFEVAIATQFEALRGEIKHKIRSLHESNVKFVKAIEIFNEDGSYEASEEQPHIEALENTEKESKEEMRKMIGESN